MQKFTNVKMNAVLGQCVTSWCRLETILLLLLLQLCMISLQRLFAGHMEVEKKTILSVMFQDLRMLG